MSLMSLPREDDQMAFVQKALNRYQYFILQFKQKHATLLMSGIRKKLHRMISVVTETG